MKNLSISFNIRKFIPQNPKTKHDILIVFLIIISLVGFVILYSNLFKNDPIALDVGGPESISGKQIISSEASESVISKIKRDVKRIQEELDNGFYSKLREFKPSGEVIVKPGRANPFVP